MYIVGYIATIMAAIVFVFLIILGAISIPDFRRYLRIRKM